MWLSDTVQHLPPAFTVVGISYHPTVCCCGPDNVTTSDMCVLLLLQSSRSRTTPSYWQYYQRTVLSEMELWCFQYSMCNVFRVSIITYTVVVHQIYINKASKFMCSYIAATGLMSQCPLATKYMTWEQCICLSWYRVILAMGFWIELTLNKVLLSHALSSSVMNETIRYVYYKAV